VYYNYNWIVTGAIAVSDRDDETNAFDKDRIKWEFFKLHANQRLTFFRYFIGLLVALFVAYFYVYDHIKCGQGTLFMYWCLILTGLGISILSAMFYFLDSRNVELIDKVKDSVPIINELSFNNEHIAYKHKQIFGIFFFMAFVLGLILFFLGGYKLGLDHECQYKCPGLLCVNEEKYPKVSNRKPEPSKPDKKQNTNPEENQYSQTMEAKPHR
jgi:hypothetical protein